MSEYEPVLDLTIWAEVREFVGAAVADSVRRTPYDEADLNNAASHLVAWTWQTAGLPLERPAVFNRDVIARFVTVGCPHVKSATRGNLRSKLLRMSEALLETKSVQRRLSPLPPSDPSIPYSATELTSLRSWASTQSTQARRRNAEVLLAAGAGAGLSASEIGELRVRDIIIDKVGVVLTVTGARSRHVPVLEAWAEPLAVAARSLEPCCYAFRERHRCFYPNLISNFVDRGTVLGVRPQTQRLRATWIVHHLNAGTPVGILMRAAGLESLEALTRYVQFMNDIEPESARLWLMHPQESPQKCRARTGRLLR